MPYLTHPDQVTRDRITESSICRLGFMRLNLSVSSSLWSNIRDLGGQPALYVVVFWSDRKTLS